LRPSIEARSKQNKGWWNKTLFSLKPTYNSFEELEVFQRAYKLSLEIHRLSLEFPKREQYGLGEQIRRASKSICANIAEGFAKQSFSVQEFKRYISIAVG